MLFTSRSHTAFINRPCLVRESRYLRPIFAPLLKAGQALFAIVLFTRHSHTAFINRICLTRELCYLPLISALHFLPLRLAPKGRIHFPALEGRDFRLLVEDPEKKSSAICFSFSPME